MATYAYRDQERTQKVYAKDCTIVDIGTRFYCENKECDAYLVLRAYRSVLAPHFAATKVHPHTGWCRHEPPKFSPTNYDETMFNYSDVMDKIISCPMKKTTNSIAKRTAHQGDGKRRSIRNLPQLYSMCKSVDHKDTYNDFVIWKILFDCRCNYILTKGIAGKHIIECTFSSYNNELQTLRFNYPVDARLSNKYKLNVQINDRELYFRLKNKVYNYENRVIVIAGDWHKCSLNCYECSISRGNQFYFPKPQPKDDPDKDE